MLTEYSLYWTNSTQKYLVIGNTIRKIYFQKILPSTFKVYIIKLFALVVFGAVDDVLNSGMLVHILEA